MQTSIFVWRYLTVSHPYWFVPRKRLGRPPRPLSARRSASAGKKPSVSNCPPAATPPPPPIPLESPPRAFHPTSLRRPSPSSLLSSSEPDFPSRRPRLPTGPFPVPPQRFGHRVRRSLRRGHLRYRSSASWSCSSSISRSAFKFTEDLLGLRGSVSPVIAIGSLGGPRGRGSGVQNSRRSRRTVA